MTDRERLESILGPLPDDYRTREELGFGPTIQPFHLYLKDVRKYLRKRQRHRDQIHAMRRISRDGGLALNRSLWHSQRSGWGKKVRDAMGNPELIGMWNARARNRVARKEAAKIERVRQSLRPFMESTREDI